MKTPISAVSVIAMKRPLDFGSLTEASQPAVQEDAKDTVPE